MKSLRPLVEKKGYRRIDCVVVAFELPDQSGCTVLADLVPLASRPNVAVVMLTNRLHRGLGELARRNGAYACFIKQFMSGDDLDRAIQRAMTFVGLMPKEDRYRPSSFSYKGPIPSSIGPGSPVC